MPSGRITRPEASGAAEKLDLTVGMNVDRRPKWFSKYRPASRNLAWALLMSIGTSVALAGASVALAAASKSCVSADEAARLTNKDVCVSAHIYVVVQLSDGTRFLDVCSPQTADEQCRFTIVSLWEDREDAGELTRYKNTDVRIRGVVQQMNGRTGIFLSHVRQFSGGPPKFRPNSLLARGFNAEQERAPISDPNLRSQGGRRSFMNTRDQESLPRK